MILSKIVCLKTEERNMANKNKIVNNIGIKTAILEHRDRFVHHNGIITSGSLNIHN